MFSVLSSLTILCGRQYSNLLQGRKTTVLYTIEIKIVSIITIMMIAKMLNGINHPTPNHDSLLRICFLWDGVLFQYTKDPPTSGRIRFRNRRPWVFYIFYLKCQAILPSCCGSTETIDCVTFVHDHRVLWLRRCAAELAVLTKFVSFLKCLKTYKKIKKYRIAMKRNNNFIITSVIRSLIETPSIVEVLRRKWFGFIRVELLTKSFIY